MEFNFLRIPQQAYVTMLIIFILLHYGKTVSTQTEQRDENIKKNAIPAVLGYAKWGELKLIEKIRIPLEKSNLIRSNFAEGVVNNDYLQLHPTRKSQCMSFASFIVQGYPYTRCYRAEFFYQDPIVQRFDNAIHWINRSPMDSAVRFLNRYPLDTDLSVG